MTRRMEQIVCGDLLSEDESDACEAARYYAFGSTDPNGSTTTIATEAILVDAPSATPSTAPSSVPSSAPSITGSKSPTAPPTLAPSLLPTVKPSPDPTLRPTRFPTPVPSLAPTALPTALPTVRPTHNALNEMILYNGKGVALLSLTDDNIIDLTIVGKDLTVRALTQGPVDQVDFFFNGKSVTSEEIEHYDLFQDYRDGIGIPYAPLAVPGKHTVSAVAELNGERTGYQSATFQVIYNVP